MAGCSGAVQTEAAVICFICFTGLKTVLGETPSHKYVYMTRQSPLMSASFIKPLRAEAKKFAGRD